MTAGTDPAHLIHLQLLELAESRCVVKAMPEYHCFFLDAADQVAATLTISCRTDNEAQSHADKILADSDHLGVEIWIGGRSLYRSRKPGFYQIPRSRR